MKKSLSGLLIFMSCLFVAACNDSSNFAPVTDLSHIEPIPKAGTHRVMQGETLYEIAWRYGLDYRSLAELNHIKVPYTIQSSQLIYLNKNAPLRIIPVKQVKAENTVIPPPPKSVYTTQSPSFVKVQKVDKEPNFSSSGWIWPAQGKIINSFSAVNKGVNIVNRLGEPIYATAAGKVVYSGHGLRGYGNLLIIKHNSLYLSAYAHNNRVMVKEGEWVKRGQQIAEMGNTESDIVMLHFEIRRAGKPINPISLY